MTLTCYNYVYDTEINISDTTYKNMHTNESNKYRLFQRLCYNAVCGTDTNNNLVEFYSVCE